MKMDWRVNDSVEIIKHRPVLQPGVITLAKTEVGFATNTQPLIEKEIGSDFAEGASHGWGVVQIPVAEGIDLLIAGINLGCSDPKISIHTLGVRESDAETRNREQRNDAVQRSLIRK